ncbi:MAG: transposase [Saprospiraceae bacterium]
MSQLPPMVEIKTFLPSTRKDVLETLILLVHCMIRCRTVCLYKCRAEAGAVLKRQDINLDSVYKRFIRFFCMDSVDVVCVGIAWLLIHLTKTQAAVFLVMDRTNWKIAQVNINVLFIGLLLPGGVFVPVLWLPLNKRGNSSTAERLVLMNRFLSVWQHLGSSPVTVLGDREFIGLEWFVRLRKSNFSLVIRVRWQDYLPLVAQSLDKTIDKTSQSIERKVKANGFFQASFTVDGCTFYYTVQLNTGTRKGKDKWLVLVSDEKDVAALSAAYRRRWGIEVFFLHCKSNGLNLEDLNLKAPQKLQLMMGLVAIAYCLSIAEGLRLEKDKPCKTKKSKNGEFRAISIFRQGFDSLKNRLHLVWELKLWLAKCLRHRKNLVLKKPTIEILTQSVQ